MPRRIVTVGLIGLAFALVVAQAIPVSRVNPPVENDLVAPPQVKALVRRACYDCHSNETVWPWYSQVAPVSWLVAHDVNEGRAELNFSSWATYTAKKQAKRLKATTKEIAKGKMPLWYYGLLHPEARLSEADRETLRNWVTAEIAKLPP